MRDIIFELQDMRYLDWAARKMSPGTPGCFLKAYEEVNGQRLYYKLSNYDSYRGVFGHECVNELIVSRIMNVLEVSHVTYQLVHAQIIIDGKEQETWISVSENFRKNNEEKLAFDLQLQKLKTEDRDYILRGIDNILSEIHINKIWEMIWKRWCYFEQIRNQEK